LDPTRLEDDGIKIPDVEHAEYNTGENPRRMKCDTRASQPDQRTDERRTWATRAEYMHMCVTCKAGMWLTSHVKCRPRKCRYLRWLGIWLRPACSTHGVCRAVIPIRSLLSGR
jgi:hypothetical protein